MILSLMLTLLVKSGLIAGAGLLASRFIARTPTERVDVLRGVVCMVLALPIIMALLPALDLAVLPAPPSASLAGSLAGNLAGTGPLNPPMWSGQVNTGGGVAVSGSLPWPTASGAILAIWILGAAIMAGRLALGLRTLDLWTRTGQVVTCTAWLQPLQQISPRLRPRLVVSDRVNGPLSWNLSPGVILIDPLSLAQRQSAPAVLAHEIGHLQRRDWIFLILSRLAVALFWFNPLVWQLHATLQARAEDVADARALETIDRHDYARTLIRLAVQPAPGQTPSLVASAMAAEARSLKRRIACIMSDLPHARRRPLTVALTLIGLVAVATPLAALELQNRHVLPAVPAPPATPEAPQTRSSSVTIYNLDEPPAPPLPPAPQVWTSVGNPAPPAPPAPPAAPQAPVYRTSIQSPATQSFVYYQPDTPENRRITAEARANAIEARQEAERASLARDQAVHIQANARAMAQNARVMADQARASADIAQRQASRALAESRVQMGQSAVEMRNGAQEMRRESAKLRDPAYRAQQIAKNRANGNTVTDAELVALIPRMLTQADEVDRSADQLARESRRTRH